MDFKIDKDFALLYGIMLGDGCLSLCNRKNRRTKMKILTITGSSIDDVPFFENVIHPILRRLRGKDTNIKFVKNENTITFNFSDEKLFDFLSQTGFPIGKKLDRLFIPKIFYDMNLVKYVVAGFFATDGSLVLTKNPNKYYPRLEIHVISKILLKEVYDYLLSLGFKGALYKCKRVNVSPGAYREMNQKYRVQFNGKDNLLLFENKIGFVNPKYKEKFDNFLLYDQDYDLLSLNLTKENLKSAKLKVNSIYGNKMALGRIELPTPSFLKPSSSP